MNNKFVKVVLSKIAIDGINVIALSPQSPLENHLMGNKAGFQFKINKTHYTIEEVSWPKIIEQVQLC